MAGRASRAEIESRLLIGCRSASLYGRTGQPRQAAVKPVDLEPDASEHACARARPHNSGTKQVILGQDFASSVSTVCLLSYRFGSVFVGLHFCRQSAPPMSGGWCLNVRVRLR